MPKSCKEDEQTLAELTSANRRSQAKCQLPTNQLRIKFERNEATERIKLFLFAI